MIRHSVAVAGISFACTFGTVVFADSELSETPIVDRSVAAELKAMQARIDALQAELDTQRKRLAELQSDKIVAQDEPRVTMV
jgi:peptidoglycan hydrolase CwlO-like protein